MIDIVLDTCTLVHANNAKSKYQSSSIKLITTMLANETLLVVDEGFDTNETKNSSYIGLEYLTNLTPGMLGYNLIQQLALTQRFSFVSRTVKQADKHFIEQLIRNKKDRVFLRVTLNSAERTLVSHDYTDYQKEKRKTIKKEIDVSIVDAADIVAAK